MFINLKFFNVYLISLIALPKRSNNNANAINNAKSTCVFKHGEKT